MLSGKRVLLVIGGGIAAYKALDLIRRLRERGASRALHPDRGGRRSSSPRCRRARSPGDKVYTDLFDRERRGRDRPYPAFARGRPGGRRAGHRRPDGQAGRRARRRSRLDRAARHRHAVLMAPAMNVRMWLHPATQRNLATLQADGVALRRPERGRDGRGGEYGPGRMAEPLEIVAAIEALLARAGRRDGRWPASASSSPPARRTSRSTRCATSPTAPRASRATRSPRPPRRPGARVTLVSGPVALPDPPGVDAVHVETRARDAGRGRGGAAGRRRGLRRRGRRLARRRGRGAEKIKKDGAGAAAARACRRTPTSSPPSRADEHARPALVIGFAAETDDVVDQRRGQARRARAATGSSPTTSRRETGVMGGDDNTCISSRRRASRPGRRSTRTRSRARLVGASAELLRGEATSRERRHDRSPAAAARRGPAAAGLRDRRRRRARPARRGPGDAPL